MPQLGWPICSSSGPLGDGWERRLCLGEWGGCLTKPGLGELVCTLGFTSWEKYPNFSA